MNRRVLEEGLVTGLVGAGLVAGWFFLLDCARGAPFLTPTLLGAVVFDGARAAEVTAISTKTIWAYSGLHVVFFLFVGWALSWMFREFEENPLFGIGYALTFVMFEVAVFGVEIAMMPDVLGVIGAWAVAAGNVLSACGMVAFLWRRYPRSIDAMVTAWHSSQS
jgi:hypothetical protein